MNELFLLLLPLAAFSGWWIGRDDKGKNKISSQDDNYFKGLSYLLEDETDKAIDIFIRLADLDDSAIDNQITLGNLFRHRGEIDRALHIHKTLEGHKEVKAEPLYRLQMALADDYYAAGIMNHAEKYYQLVAKDGFADFKRSAQLKLIRLFSEQSMWQQAIDMSKIYDPYQKAEIQQQVAHFYCELADIQKKQDDLVASESFYNQALNADEDCVRARIGLGGIAKIRTHYVFAIKHFQAIEQQDPSFLLEVIDDLETCYLEINQLDEWLGYLQEIESKYRTTVITLRIIKEIIRTQGSESAILYIKNKLLEKPDIILLRSYLTMLEEKDSNEEIELSLSVINQLLKFALKYRCKECGFRGNTLLWQCPGCRTWGRFAPVSDVGLKETA